MKNKIKYLVGLPLLTLFSCNNFMDLENFQNIPTEEAYNTVQDVQNGLNGAYYALGHNYFYGRNVVALGDMASDNAVADPSTGHFYAINTYSFSDTDGDLDALWAGGYRVMDRATRTIQGVAKVMADAERLHLTDEDIANLHSYLSQCYGLRALAAHALVNIFAYPYQKGTNNEQLGIVLLTDAPLPTFEPTSRSSVRETYAQILSDIAEAKKAHVKVDAYNFQVGTLAVNPNQFYMNLAAVYALEARVSLYMEEYNRAIVAADSAIELRGSNDISNDLYLKMWSSLAISDEDIMTLAKTEDDNLSANSLNTLYGSYGGALTEELVSIFAPTDIRKQLIYGTHPMKFDGIPTSASVNNVPVFRKSEMYLIKAESYAHLGNLGAARQALLYTAKRNTAITSVNQLPAGKEDLLSFIAQERRREFFEEGFRWFDARRTGQNLDIAGGLYPDFNVSAFVYPIPASEINAGFGVVQNPGWENAMP